MASTTQSARDASLLIDTLRIEPWAEPGTIAAAWSDPAVDVPAVAKLADAEGAALWLHRRLKSLGVTLDGAPGHDLRAIAKRHVAQSLRGDAELATTLAILDSVDVPGVPLKGAAMRRLVDRVPYANARTSSDVDVIVPAEMSQRGWDALVANGYTVPKSSAVSQHHLPGLVGMAGIGVELHVTTGMTVSPDEAWRRATSGTTTVTLEGRALRMPSDTELLWHWVTHALKNLQVSVSEAVRLRHYVDGAALLAADAAIDWDCLAARLRTTECAHPDVARSWIATAAALSGRPLPPSALGTAVAAPIKIERLLAWRIRVATRTSNARWTDKLLEEGTRGEAMLPQNPGYPNKGPFVRTRHFIASRAARMWWRIRR